jgi:hypothetical protein
MTPSPPKVGTLYMPSIGITICYTQLSSSPFSVVVTTDPADVPMLVVALSIERYNTPLFFTFYIRRTPFAQYQHQFVY